MTEFFETKAGVDFMEKQFPKLLGELTRIADALEKPMPGWMGQPAEETDDFLEQLYYGNLEPASEINGEDLQENLAEIIRLQDILCSKLTGEQWELYEELQTLCEKRSSRETELGFYTGFRMAMRMMMAGLAPVGTRKRNARDAK